MSEHDGTNVLHDSSGIDSNGARPMVARRRRARTAMLAGGALVIGLGVIALPAAGQEGGGNNGKHFTLFNHDTHQAFLDLGDPGPSVGDQYVFGGDVSEEQGGTPIGRMSGQCATISDTELLCTSSFTFNGGQISFQALVDVTVFFAGQPFEFAVTGGTGPLPQGARNGGRPDPARAAERQRRALHRRLGLSLRCRPGVPPDPSREVSTLVGRAGSGWAGPHYSTLHTDLSAQEVNLLASYTAWLVANPGNAQQFLSMYQ
ncbi:MAG TPA: hypothetical protein VE078_07280 [Thermoanaerobaculia bacterium]|nr:hypothetical protein [Thermoanaerobaculia bacterium]